ncbi:MAG: serine/threonine protein kinase [Sandaracinaceae bacterium]|nr:serine/threonine protein kinase [Sandaracinaceae bacterium]
MELRGKTLLGKYHLERAIGQGGMGTVWQAVHTGTGRKVAIKMLDARYAGNAAITERFGREARSASAIEHPGIVEVLDLDRTEDGTPFLVMELLEGETLTQRIKKHGKLTQQQASDVLLQLLEALGAAHERGIVHRDIKPDNIVLSPKAGGGDRITILDFGISQKADEVRSHLTQTGAVLGTPHYMPPEQALGDTDLDSRADIYALGVVLYEMVVGDVPFDAGNYNALLQTILHEVAKSPRSRGAGVHPAFETMILACMDKDRERRPQTMAELKTMLVKANKGEQPIQAVDGDWGDLISLGSAQATRAAPPPAAHVPPTTGGRPITLSDMSDLPALELDIARSPLAPPLSSSAHEFSDEFDAPSGGVSLELSDSRVAAAPQGVRTARKTPQPAAEKELTPEPIRASPVERLTARVREFPPAFWRVVAGLVLFLALVVAIRIAVRPSEVAESLSEPVLPTTQDLQSPPVAPMQDANANVTLTGVPPEALIRLDGFPISAMPLRVRRGTVHSIEISAPGYETRRISLTPQQDVTLAANMRRVD